MPTKTNEPIAIQPIYSEFIVYTQTTVLFMYCDEMRILISAKIPMVFFSFSSSSLFVTVDTFFFYCVTRHVKCDRLIQTDFIDNNPE